MKLYYSPGTCSLSVHIVARELGLDLELEKVDILTKRTASGRDYLEVNSKGYVPALELDNGSVLTEGTAIMQYLADISPGQEIAPMAMPIERAHLREALSYIGTELHKGFSPLFSPDSPVEMKAKSERTLRKRYALVEKALAQQPYVLGERFTLADAYLFTITTWAKYVNLDLSEFAALTEYQARIGSRPMVRAAMEAEGLIN